MKANTLIAISLSSLMLVILGHDMVPHHHHFDEVHSHFTNTSSTAESHPHGSHEDVHEDSHFHVHCGEVQVDSPVDQNRGCKQENRSGDPAGHCHAFNGLEYIPGFEKRTSNPPEKTSQYPCPFDLPFLNGQDSDHYSCRYITGPPPLLNGYLGTSPGLRAPPCIS